MAGMRDDGSTTFTVEGVREHAIPRARAMLTQMGMTGISENAGIAEGHGGRVDYRYDPAAGSVACDVLALPEPFKVFSGPAGVRAVREIVEGALHPAVGDEGGLSRPGKAGVYCYVIPTLTNNAGLDLSYATSDFSHGSLASYTSTVSAGGTESLFEAHSGNASGLGVSGSVTYQLTDGTPLTFTFNLLSTCDYSFAAGFTGPNAGRYKPPSISENEASLDGYTYLEPVVVIEKK
ncbi:hypothetical protein GA707_19140 [Nostocoides sp. F2B08]|uniref:hypothetical protein n=1 Tax=Nostocoides sp. F2B08 TaxID=2653936 RepID=UPI0012632951|nr:hypothetical protein [Tetrasphaera sp. F2B08]KAB7740616.1 hypothetical protein GA707_19140 [Tetrasphaera sp. F2B08]